MKNITIKTGILALAFMALSVASCKDANKVQKKVNEHAEIDVSDHQDANVEVVLKEYFKLKDALVQDDNEQAKALGETFVKSLDNLDSSVYDDTKKSELEGLIKDASEHAKEISTSAIKKQRGYFKSLTEEVTKIIGITGSANKIYEQFCPMYDGGSVWLSLSDEIRNPYYGSAMLQCGKVQREI